MKLTDLFETFNVEFKTFENWEQFIFLSQNLEEFRNLAEDKFRSELLSRFFHRSFNDWEFKYNHYSLEATWFIKGFQKPEHFKIQIKDLGYAFSISAGDNPLLIQKLSSKFIFDLKYRPLILTENFGRIDAVSNYKIEQFGDFNFQIKNDRNIRKQQIIWFAFHQSNELVNQIEIKINRFVKNPKLTELIKELNAEIDNEIADF